MPARQLPARPDLRQLRYQAKDLLRAIHGGDPSALADLKEYHPERIDPENAKLADAQLVLARSYQTSSWPQLVVLCNLIDATSRDDFDAVRDLISAHPEVARAVDESGHPTMANAANLGLQRVITRMRHRGARDIGAAMANPELRQSLDELRLLGRIGARPASDVVGGAVELLQGDDFAFMVEIGAVVRDHKGLTALALETYARNPAGKHRILDVMADQGVALPDTPAMAAHRGRLDLLEQQLRRDPALLQRTFAHRDFFPPELECHAEEALALVGVSLDGATLLHMAADYEELEVARWLLDRGADTNVRADVDASGFGGHTPLFNCVVTYNAGRRTDALARLLLDRGADPNARASIRSILPFAGDHSAHEYRNVTPLGWGRSFHEPTYLSQPALRIVAERGGHE